MVEPKGAVTTLTVRVSRAPLSLPSTSMMTSVSADVVARSGRAVGAGPGGIVGTVGGAVVGGKVIGGAVVGGAVIGGAVVGGAGSGFGVVVAGPEVVGGVGGGEVAGGGVPGEVAGGVVTLVAMVVGELAGVLVAEGASVADGLVVAGTLSVGPVPVPPVPVEPGVERLDDAVGTAAPLALLTVVVGTAELEPEGAEPEGAEPEGAEATSGDGTVPVGVGLTAWSGPRFGSGPAWATSGTVDGTVESGN